MGFGGAPCASFSTWGGAWAPLRLLAGLLSTWMGCAAPLGDAVGQGRCWRGPLGYWCLGCDISVHFFSLQEFMVSLVRSLGRLGHSWGCSGQSQLPEGFRQLRVCIMARWHISLWGFSLLLSFQVSLWLGPRAFAVLPSVPSRETVDSRTGIIELCAVINMCLQFPTNIPRAGCTSLKLPVPVAFVVT